MNQPQYTIIQGKGISKADKELVEAILGGEMQNAWTPGDGIDQRGDEGEYSKRAMVRRRDLYKDNYDRIFRGK